MNERLMTVSELAKLLRRTIEQDDLLQNLWVKGEISNFKDHTSGHAYFTIKDERSSLRCVMFRSYRQKLGFQPQNGQQILAHGNVGIFERDSQVQLYVERLLPEGVGELYLAYEQLKQKLHAEGLFAPESKKALPAHPRAVGLVTSPTGAAVRDMVRILRRRAPWVKIYLFPCLVQGEEAKHSVAAAIRLAEAFADEHPLDLLIVGRGGGSIEELWTFNTEEVVRAIAGCRLPIISAVGHETDVTLADLAADRRAATPSMAAEIAVPDRVALARHLQQMSARLHRVMRFRHQQQQVDLWEQRLTLAIRRHLESKRQRWERLAIRLEDLSPLRVMQRGYSMCFDESGQIVKDARRLIPGDRITVRFEHGAVAGRVEEQVADIWSENGRGPYERKSS